MLKAARVVVLLGLTALAGLVVAALAPLAAGYSAHVVTSGSMAPRVNPGDVVVTHPVTAAELRTGQVLLIHDPGVPGGLLLHRLVSFDEKGRLVTRGDANQSDDSVHADPADVRGLAVLRAPWVGLPALWRMQGRYGALAATAGVLVAAAVFVSAGARRRAVEVEPDGRPEQLDVDLEGPTVMDIPPVRDAEPDLAAPSVRGLPPVLEASSVRGLPPVWDVEPVLEASSIPGLPPVWDVEPVLEASSIRGLPPVPAARRTAKVPSVRGLPPVPAARRTPVARLARELPRVPAARPARQVRTTVVAAVPAHPASSSSAAVRLSKTEGVRPAAVRVFARPAVTNKGREANSAPRTRHPLPPVPPAVRRPRDDRGAAVRAAGPRVRAADDHSGCLGRGHFCGQPRR